MKTVTYLFVDFENLQPPADDIAKVRGDRYRLWVFHGPHQNKFAAKMVKAWQPLGDCVRFVQSTKTGKNALDFHIAFCLGQVQQQDAIGERAAKYVVVTKDGGFNPLFDFMNSLGCAVGKAKSIPDALALETQLKCTFGNGSAQTHDTRQVAGTNAVKTTARKSASQSKSAVLPVNGTGALNKLLASLRAHSKNRPTTQKALKNHIPSMVGGQVTKKEVTELMKQLVDEGAVTISGQKVEYKIPKSKK